ncbi:MAG: hypothetical protein LBI61_01205 [Puniceicoccales bacterium]|nr:hypothetical protein [Puniceicoccales bacterium]
MNRNLIKLIKVLRTEKRLYWRTKRDVEVLKHSIPPKAISPHCKPAYCVTNSPNVIKLVKRFIKACNDLGGEHFEAGKEMQLEREASIK